MRLILPRKLAIEETPNQQFDALWSLVPWQLEIERKEKDNQLDFDKPKKERNGRGHTKPVTTITSLYLDKFKK